MSDVKEVALASEGNSMAEELFHCNGGHVVSSAYKRKNGELYCPQCFPEGSPKAAMVIFQQADGRVLCVFNRHFKTMGLPCGKLEDNESSRDAAIREAQEETNLQPRDLGFCHTEPADEDFMAVDVYVCRDWSALRRARAPEDTSQAWLYPDEVVEVSKFGGRLRETFLKIGIEPHGRGTRWT